MNIFSTVLIGVIYFYLSSFSIAAFSRGMPAELSYYYGIVWGVHSLGGIVIISTIILYRKLNNLKKLITKESNEVDEKLQ